MINYSLKKSEVEGGEDIILKEGEVHEFTMSQVNSNLVELNKAERELSSQIELENAKMTNVENHHEIVKELEDEKMNAVAVFYSAKLMRDACQKKLEQVIAMKEELAKDLEQIKEQTGAVLPGV